MNQCFDVQSYSPEAFNVHCVVKDVLKVGISYPWSTKGYKPANAIFSLSKSYPKVLQSEGVFISFAACGTCLELLLFGWIYMVLVGIN